MWSILSHMLASILIVIFRPFEVADRVEIVGDAAIVGYLLAGIVIGPYSPPFSLITDTEHIAQLSHVGLVVLMFAIGPELSLSELRRMDMPPGGLAEPIGTPWPSDWKPGITSRSPIRRPA